LVRAHRSRASGERRQSSGGGFFLVQTCKAFQDQVIKPFINKDILRLRIYLVAVNEMPLPPSEDFEDYFPDLFVNHRNQVSIIQEPVFRQYLSDALAAAFCWKDLETPLQLFPGDPLMFDKKLADFFLVVIHSGVDEVPIPEVEACCIAGNYKLELAGERGQV